MVHVPQQRRNPQLAAVPPPPADVRIQNLGEDEFGHDAHGAGLEWSGVMPLTACENALEAARREIFKLLAFSSFLAWESPILRKRYIFLEMALPWMFNFPCLGGGNSSRSSTMKFFPVLLLLVPTLLPAATVNFRLSADKITGHYQASGTQAWFAENNSFFSDVADNGFDFVVSYDTSTPYFNQSGSLGTQFAASITTGTIGTRDVSDIANLTTTISILAVGGSQPRQVVIFTARETPFPGITGYIWNEAIFVFTDLDSSLPSTTLPDGVTLLTASDSTSVSVRNSRNAGGVSGTRELGSDSSDTIAAALIPEPTTSLLLAASTLLLFKRRRCTRGLSA